MAEVTYTEVTWTSGDIITEAKLDNMVANDRAVDAMAQGVRLTERTAPDTPPANTLHIYAKDKAGISSLYAKRDNGSEFEITASKPTFVFTVPLALLTGTSLTPALIVPRDLTITKAFAYVKSNPTGAAIIIDINKNGTSIWSATQANRVRINAGGQSGTQTAFDTTSLLEGDVLTLDLDQVGSTLTGSDLTVELRCE